MQQELVNLYQHLYHVTLVVTFKKVKINDKFSSFEEILFGLSHGSILGPLLELRVALMITRPIVLTKTLKM